MPVPAPSATPKAPEHHLERDDHVYFSTKSGAACGRVISHGAHGAVVEVNGKRGKVKHERMLGHKQRAQPKVKVVHAGEDGFLTRDEHGRHRFISDPVPADPMLKAMPAGRANLSLQDVTDKSGHRTKRWKNLTPDVAKGKRKAAPEDGAGGKGPAAGEEPPEHGLHNVASGHRLTFKMGDKAEGRGVVVGKPGVHGAHVRARGGKKHKVLYSDVTGREDSRAMYPADSFTATAFAKQHDQADVTPESILAKFPPETAGKMDIVAAKVDGLTSTAETHRVGMDSYTPERTRLHEQIVRNLIPEDLIARATPAEGEQPIFTILGGRGGSGKSGLKGEVYDADSAVVIDPDAIKEQLPEYEGWNANQVHEESGDIANLMVKRAREMGLNVVLDATMKTSETAVGRVKEFRKDGYRVEAHYMHLARQMAAERAVQRFLDSGRYVPLPVVLGNTSNEASFDKVKAMSDSWSFWDNNVPKGQKPVLISEKP